MCSSDQIRVRFSCCTSFMLCQYQYVEILHRLENRFMDSPCVFLIKRKHCAAAIDMPDRRSTINPAIAFVNAYMISDAIPQVFIHRTDSISFTAVRAKKEYSISPSRIVLRSGFGITAPHSLQVISCSLYHYTIAFNFACVCKQLAIFFY